MRKYSDPLLLAVLVFAEYFWNVTPASIEGRLYKIFTPISYCSFSVIYNVVTKYITPPLWKWRHLWTISNSQLKLTKIKDKMIIKEWEVNWRHDFFKENLGLFIRISIFQLFLSIAVNSDLILKMIQHLFNMKGCLEFKNYATITWRRLKISCLVYFRARLLSYEIKSPTNCICRPFAETIVGLFRG